MILSESLHAKVTADPFAAKMFSDLALQTPADVGTKVTLGEVIAVLCLAENDPKEPPMDYYSVARWLARRYET